MNLRTTDSRAVSTAFERRLEGAGVPASQRPDHHRWVRFYYLFCHQYGFSTVLPTSLGPCLTKLAAKGQSVAQRSQAERLLGHSNIKTTMIYLQTVPSVTLKEAKRHPCRFVTAPEERFLG